MELSTIKKYLNISENNTNDDELILLLQAAAMIQATRITSESNALIDVALLKDIASNYQNRENYLDPESGGDILSNSTIKILNQFRPTIIL
jgi:uncharacterized phage protein (predicted DNA packaging)